MLPVPLTVDPALLTPLELAAALPAMVLAPSRTLAARARLRAAGLHGSVRWAAHAEDRRWVAGRYALPLQETPHARRVHRVGLRHYALTQRCMVVEEHAALRGAVGVVGDLPAAGDRTIFAFVHSPAMWLCLYGLTNAGTRIAPVVADWFWEDPLLDLRTACVTSVGGRVIDVGGGFAEVREALVAGLHPVLAVDVPGSTPVRFLAKPARVRSGIARLAWDTGATVVPVHGVFAGGRPAVVLGAPIRPTEDAGALMRELTAAVEAPLLARPERWMPYTADLWPDRCGPYRAAYDEDQPAAEVGSVA